MDNQNSKTTGTPPKLPYEAPALKLWGTVAGLTAGHGGKKNETGGGTGATRL